MVGDPTSQPRSAGMQQVKRRRRQLRHWSVCSLGKRRLIPEVLRHHWQPRQPDHVHTCVIAAHTLRILACTLLIAMPATLQADGRAHHQPSSPQGRRVHLQSARQKPDRVRSRPAAAAAAARRSRRRRLHLSALRSATSAQDVSAAKPVQMAPRREVALSIYRRPKVPQAIMTGSPMGWRDCRRVVERPCGR